MIRAVVFDFDGVIANSEPLHYRAYHGVLAEVGVVLSEPDYYERYLGYDDAGLFRTLAADRGLAWSGEQIERLVAEKARQLEALEQGSSLLFPGAAGAVGRLAARCPLAIASGALGVEIRRVLSREGLLDSFLAIVGAEDTPASKPAPDPYRLAVARLAAACGQRLEPGECAAIEDSRWGLESARLAGLRTIGITHTYPAAHLDQADRVISHLDALTWEFLTTMP